MIYFAYGLLVNRQVLLEVCPGAVPLRTARIENHAICFTGSSEVWGGGTATIGLSPNCDLWGALYEIDPAGRDAIEGSRWPDGYVWAFTPVEDEKGDRVHAGLLVKVRDLKRSSPSQDYLETLKKGWQEWGLDPVAMLKNSPPSL